jgi:hypothetical protein
MTAGSVWLAAVLRDARKSARTRLIECADVIRNLENAALG